MTKEKVFSALTVVIRMTWGPPRAMTGKSKNYISLYIGGIGKTRKSRYIRWVKSD